MIYKYLKINIYIYFYKKQYFSIVIVENLAFNLNILTKSNKWL